MNANLHVRYELKKSLQYLKGVGPARAQTLAKLGLYTIEDLLHYYPKRHDDRSHFLPIAQVCAGEKRSICGEVTSINVIASGPRLSIFTALISDSSGKIYASWYRKPNRKYDVFAGLNQTIKPKSRMLVYGAVDWNARYSGLPEIKVEEFEILPEGPMPDCTGGEALSCFSTGGEALSCFSKSLNIGRIVPVYPLVEKLDIRRLRTLIWNTLKQYGPKVNECLPFKIRAKLGLPERHKAIVTYHFPNSFAELEKARQRLAFEEFFLLESAMAKLRLNRIVAPKVASCVPKRTLLSPFKQNLGFGFTKGQIKAINEIFKDMASGKPMNRLLQGDVGSGKTVVALSAILLAVENGLQTTIVAPTEILAEQHALTFEKLLSDLPVKFECLTSATPKKRRQQIIKESVEGTVNILIGTHAVMSKDVTFARLGLVVIDEQHRFGVRQRLSVVEKGRRPDLLVMTATPIPRSLALTLYGDLDISVISELPPGRKSAITKMVSENDAWKYVAEEVEKGNQAYIVYPIIDESEKLKTRTGRSLRALLAEKSRIMQIFGDFSTGILHGGMPYMEKRAAMDKFRNGEVKILLATPVIEIGIDVSQANTMVIIHPERFGLSQLHQLRGRVGRSANMESRCLLITEEYNSLGQDTLNRLEVFCKTNDGFKLAEEDLKLRGPGEFFGENQHGLAPFKVARLGYDNALLAKARELAFATMNMDPGLQRPENRMIAQEISKRFRANLNLGSIG